MFVFFVDNACLYGFIVSVIYLFAGCFYMRALAYAFVAENNSKALLL